MDWYLQALTCNGKMSAFQLISFVVCLPCVRNASGFAEILFAPEAFRIKN